MSMSRTGHSSFAVCQGRDNENKELAPLSLDEGGADLDGGAYHTVEERELFPTESINSEASVAHLIVTGDGISALRLACVVRLLASASMDRTCRVRPQQSPPRVMSASASARDTRQTTALVAPLSDTWDMQWVSGSIMKPAVSRVGTADVTAAVPALLMRPCCRDPVGARATAPFHEAHHRTHSRPAITPHALRRRGGR